MYSSAAPDTVQRPHITLALTGGALAICQSVPPTRPPSGPVMWPVPPELPRYLYEATLHNAASLGDESDGDRVRRVLSGECGSKVRFG